MKFNSMILATIGSVGLASSAHAVTLLSLTNPTPGSSASYSLSFVATGTSSTLSDGGYQVPSFTQFTNNVVSGGAGNLLGQVWTFTPAASGSDSDQYNDGTSVNALDFGGVTEGSYDVYSQTFATTPGATYIYSFDVPRFAGNPNGFFVDVTNATGAVPEPASWALMLVGLGLVGFTMRNRNVRTTVSYS